LTVPEDPLSAGLERWRPRHDGEASSEAGAWLARRIVRRFAVLPSIGFSCRFLGYDPDRHDRPVRGDGRFAAETTEAAESMRFAGALPHRGVLVHRLSPESAEHSAFVGEDREARYLSMADGRILAPDLCTWESWGETGLLDALSFLGGPWTGRRLHPTGLAVAELGSRHRRRARRWRLTVRAEDSPEREEVHLWYTFGPRVVAYDAPDDWDPEEGEWRHCGTFTDETRNPLPPVVARALIEVAWNA